MSVLVPAILATQGGECRIAITHDEPGKNWVPDGAWGSANLAGAFDASDIYASFGEAKDALTKLRSERAKQSDPEAVVSDDYTYRFISLPDKPYATIRRDGLAWQVRQREIDRAHEDALLQPV